MAPTYAMSCLICGTPLAEDGSCPACGAGSGAPAPAVPGSDVHRDRATVTPPPGGALVPGRVDHLGVFQAAGQRTTWFVRIAVLIAALAFAVAVAAVIIAAAVVPVSGVWLLPSEGLGALVGTLIVVISLGVLLVVGTMLWLLARRDAGPASGPCGGRRI